MNTLTKQLAKRSGLVHSFGKATDMSTGLTTVTANFNLAPDMSRLEKFVELLVDECCLAVQECDESPKMILHEPYQTIIAKIMERMYGEAQDNT